MNSVIKSLLKSTSFFALLLAGTASAQTYNPGPWRYTLEHILSEVENRTTVRSNMDATELELCRAFYADDIRNRKIYWMHATQTDSITPVNAEMFIEHETNVILQWFQKFKVMNNGSHLNAMKHETNPSIEGVGDTIRPFTGPAQPPCRNLGFEDGTMNGWKACGAIAFSVPAGAVHPTSPAYPWGFLAYNKPCCNNRMDADCYGPTGNFTKAANCYNYLAAVPTPPYKDSYQLRVFNAGMMDSLDPTTPAVYPGEAHSVMVGDYCGTAMGAGILQQRFQVTAANAAFTYMYSIFLQNPSGHGYTQQPTFQAIFMDDNADTIANCGSFFQVAGPNMPGWKKISNINYLHSWADSTYVKPWACAFVSLRKYIGQNITVQFITRDCGQGAHFGYAYVSAKCDTLAIKKTPTGNCKAPSAVLTAPQSCGISGYQWSGPCISGPTNGPSITVTCDGVYTVILTSAAGGCSDTIRDTVVLAQVGGIQAGFTVSGNCGVMTFTDTTNISGASYNWSFPGGSPSSSTSQIPGNVTYPAGTYTATLIVTDSLGCTDTVTQTFTITQPPFQANFSAPPVCVGNPTSFQDQSIGPPTSWNWNFGNGGSSTSQNPTTTYTAAGTYSVTLITSSGICGSDTITLPVTVNPLPVPAFSAPSVCLNNPSPFTDQSTGNNTVTNWSWNFGDGNTSTVQNPSHTYTAAGTYTATLIVTNNFGCKDTLAVPVQVTPKPVPNFSSGPVCLGNATCFNDLSSIASGNITGWTWNFGDASTSTTQNPCHTYAQAGTYSVTLTVSSGNNCSDQITQTVSVLPGPTSAFQSSAPCLGSALTLTNGSVSSAGDPIISWSWQMPGGSPASAASQNTSTTYQSAGTHNVTLIVTSQSGCSDTLVQQVLVYNPPVAALSGSGAGCAPLCITNFQDLSTNQDGNLTSWQWSFPGGSPASSGQQNPGTICYNQPGTHPVLLTVTNTYGCSNTVTMPASVIAHPGTNANFSVAPDQAPVDAPVFNFTSLWSPNPGVTNWVWDFGDGQQDSMTVNPVHSYSAAANGNGHYFFTVTLYVSNQYGCWDTISKVVELIPEFTFYIPNTFSPNGDFMNEYFFGKSRGVKEYNIAIFDRWGNKIWDCHEEGDNQDWDKQGQDGMSSACQWDGKVVPGGVDMNGNSRQLAQEDVYVWKVNLIDIFGRQHQYVGHVNVVR